MDGFLMRPKIDFAFKEIMMDGEARRGFLSSVLGIRPEDIKQAGILNASLRKVHEDDKLGVLDVRIAMNNDTEIDVEINLAPLSIWAARALFYLSKMYTEQIRSGQGYDVLKKCVSISILDFRLFREGTGFYSRFHIQEDTRHFLYTDKMEFHVIELPKLPREMGEGCGGLELWARFINAERKEEFEMLAERDSYIKNAYRRLQIISQDEDKRMEYEAREKAIRDHEQMMKEAEQRGEERGEKRGQERGERIGQERGEKIGQERGERIGQERLGRLVTRLMEDGRYSDLEHSVKDMDLQRELMEEYGI